MTQEAGWDVGLRDSSQGDQTEVLNLSPKEQNLGKRPRTRGRRRWEDTEEIRAVLRRGQELDEEIRGNYKCHALELW